jgi:5-hydroxyisourate hydrolase
MSQLTTHILDLTKGKPAEGIGVMLFQQRANDWIEMTISSTNHDGRIPHLLQKEVLLEPGIYKFRFLTREYFEQQGVQSFYPFIEIAFNITGNEHYHVPLLLSPYGYSTYRGS